MSDADVLFYVHAAYGIAALILGGITLTTVTRYRAVKRRERAHDA